MSSPITEQDIQNKIQALKDSGHPTMSEWATKLNDSIKMTPDTVQMNQRTHAYDLLVTEREEADRGSYSI